MSGTTPNPSVAAALQRVSILRRPPGWIVLVTASPFLAAGYLLLPTTGPAQDIAYPVYGVIGTIAILIGIHTRRPPRRAAWQLLALGLALLAAGDVIYSILAFGVPEVAYPSAADIAYLAGYGALVAGVLSLIRGRVPGGDRTHIIDASILSAGVGSIFWVAIIQPTIVDGLDPLAGLVSVAYPAMDLVLLALCLRVLLSSVARPRYIQVLVVGLAIYFAADVVYALAIVNGTYADGNPVDGGWIVGILLIGAAAMHPSVADPVATAAPADGRLSRSRLALLAIAALIAPAILMFQELQAGDGVIVGLAAEWTILFGLVLVRLAVTVSELVGSLQQRTRLQRDLAHQAHHDPLTRLANRLLFEERLGLAMATASAATGLIFVDLDDFKTINDTLGHGTGDDLLRVLAGRVQRGLRSSDLAARLGGDEFAILVEGCDDLAMVEAVAERLLAALRVPVKVGTRELLVHASAGVAMGHSGATGKDLMRDADIAMYQAKAHGKDRAEAFEATMHSDVIRGYELRTELAAAIEKNAFVLHFQAVVNLVTGAIVGAEALVRWDHPERGLLGPQEFIPQAESSGLIHPLAKWILREACHTAAGWQHRPAGQRPSISVNLAASQLLQPGLVDDVAQILAETGLPAGQLILEVTESALVDVRMAREALLRLRTLGVQLALDDFGTGYSALSYLAELPFDIIKIDQSFIAAIGQGRRVDALLEGILGLCDALELMTVAEGIEQDVQLDRLVALDCRFGQGYLFARPVPAAEFDRLLPPPGLAARHDSDERGHVEAAARRTKLALV
jgi:diguanylate cyclase (GGDEF)-like protein